MKNQHYKLNLLNVIIKMNKLTKIAHSKLNYSKINETQKEMFNNEIHKEKFAV